MESAKNLISTNRLDVFSKTPLAYAWANDLDDSWGQEIYSAYMLSTRPSGGFSEDNAKFSLRDYIESFRSLFESIRKCGFDSKISSIPSTPEGITNGAHRLAIALALDANVSREISTDLNHNYDYKYMQSIGLSEKFIDAIVLEYLEYAHHTTVFCAMGIRQSLAEEIQKELELAGFALIYRKAIRLSKIGQRRLMKVLYGSSDWWATEFYESLVLERFNDENSSYFFFVMSKESEVVTHVKSQIREKYFDQFTFKKFHSTDNRVETIRVAETILNENSLLIINQAPIESERNIISAIKNNPYLQKLNPKQFAIDGSALLEILGIRGANDLDYIEIQKRYSEIPSNPLSHNSEYQTLPINPTQLIMDPRNYAVIDGYRFVSVPQIIAFKSQRGEPKDLSDISSLCASNMSGSIYGDQKSRREVAYLRFRLNTRRQVNILISPLPIWLQNLIRKSYVQLRDAFRV